MLKINKQIENKIGWKLRVFRLILIKKSSHKNEHLNEMFSYDLFKDIEKFTMSRIGKCWFYFFVKFNEKWERK